MTEMDPKGLFLWVATESEEEEIELLKRVCSSGAKTNCL